MKSANPVDEILESNIWIVLFEKWVEGPEVSFIGWIL
jgi:hypothetical protein